MIARAAAAVLLLLALAGPARAAETAYVFDENTTTLRLVALDGTGTTYGNALPVTGLGPGDAVAGIDVRPADGKLYALTVNAAANPDTVELYRLDVATTHAAADSIGTVPAFEPTNGASFGIDFTPVADRLRVVTSSGQSVRVNPNDASLSGADAALAYAPGDPNEGESPAVTAIAYAGGSTAATLYGVDTLPAPQLVRIGGVDGIPSPNTGLMTTIGATGMSGGLGGALDISAADGRAYWLRTGFSTAQVFHLELSTGRSAVQTPLNGHMTSLALLPAATISLASTVAGFSEAAGEALLEVDRAGPSTGTTTVGYTIEPGTSDVAATSGTLTFAEGETRKQIAVAIPQDAAAEGREAFLARLGEPAGNATAGAVLGNAQTIVSVEDDDVPATAPAPAPTPGPADRSRPTVRITGVPKTTTRARLLKGFRARVLPSEAVTLEVSLRANPRRGAFTSAYELALFSKRFGRSAFTRSVNVRPSRRLTGRIRRATKVRLVVDAVDAAGNHRRTIRTIRVKRR